MEHVYTLDFETTNIDPKVAIPVEVSLRQMKPCGMLYDTFIDPGIPIPVETSAIHHITDNDVRGSDTWPVVKQDLADILTAKPGKPLNVLVAHNAKYEQGVLGEFVPVLWVCTYKCAVRVWEHAPSYKNEVLRYWLKLDNLGRAYHQQAHSAGHDTAVTEQIFQKLLEHTTLEQLIEWTDQPTLLRKMPFGKHFNQPWNEIPGGYLDWILKQTDMDVDVKYCAAEEVKRRKGR